MFSIFPIALFFAPDNSGNPLPLGVRIVCALLTIACLGGAYCIFRFYTRYQLIADKTGIRWRGAWGDWRSSAWSEVLDYYNAYLHSYANGNSYLAPVLVTAQGLVRIHECSPETNDSLRQIVRTHATAARIHEWDLIGTRRIDPFPQTFRYWNSFLPWKIAVFVACTIGFYAIVGGKAAFLIYDTAKLIGWREMQQVIWGTLVLFLVCTWIPLGCGRVYLQLWKRRGEQITVSPEEVRYENTLTNTRLSVTWNEVSDYFYGKTTEGKKGHYVLSLRGTGERQITWNWLLQNSTLLLRIVQKYASRPPVEETDYYGWRVQNIHEKTGGSDPATWQSGAVGIGGRVFRYQNSNTTLYLWAGTVATTFFLIASLMQWQKNDRDAFWFCFVYMLFGALPTIWYLLRAIFCRVETDDIGITLYTIFGKTHLYWYTVTDYKDTESNLTVSGKNGTRITCGKAINGYKELQKEIERYAPPPQTGWAKKSDEAVKA